MHLSSLLPACWLLWCTVLLEKDLFHPDLNRDRYSPEIITSQRHVLSDPILNNCSERQCIVALIFFRLHRSTYQDYLHLWVQYRDIPFKKVANSCVIRVPFATNSQ